MKDFFSKVLNGMSIAIVCAIIPNALLGEILKLLIPSFPPLQHLYDATAIVMSMLPVLVGVLVGMQFKLTQIQTASIGLATVIGSGVISKTADGVFTIGGIGVVINAGITAALAVLFVRLIGTGLKEYSILLIPVLTVAIPGMIGFNILPYVQDSANLVGDGVAYLTNLQPVVMGALIAVAFGIIILSPISTVGIATVIMLSGIGSGAANLGIVAVGMGLCFASYKANSLGTALAHVLGSPKIQMSNFFLKPVIALPMLITAAILGGLAGVLNVQGTPYSAGMGLAGLVGPLNFINLADGGWNATNITIMLGMFLILPLLLNLFFIYLFKKKLKLVQDTDYKLDFE